jgi:hypothetical protein
MMMIGLSNTNAETIKLVGLIDKEQTSYNDLPDALRLSLKGYTIN